MQLAARKILDASPIDVLENFVGKFKTTVLTTAK